jgi:hypothetical protein
MGQEDWNRIDSQIESVKERLNQIAIEIESIDNPVDKKKYEKELDRLDSLLENLLIDINVESFLDSVDDLLIAEGYIKKQK